jgi:hypothetical protein
MTNHVHLIVTPNSPEALAKAISRTDFNAPCSIAACASGHFGRIAFLLPWRMYTSGGPWLRGQKRAGGLSRVGASWSSAEAHVTGTDRFGLLDMAAWAEAWKPAKWMEALRDRDDEARELICKSTKTGRPWGGDRFIKQVERKLERAVRLGPSGDQIRKDPTGSRRMLPAAPRAVQNHRPLQAHLFQIEMSPTR